MSMKDVISAIKTMFSPGKPLGIQMGPLAIEETKKQRVTNCTVAYSVDRCSLAETLKLKANLMICYKDFRSMYTGKRLTLAKSLIRNGVNVYSLGREWNTAESLGTDVSIIQDMFNASIQEPVLTSEGTYAGYIARLPEVLSFQKVANTMSKHLEVRVGGSSFDDPVELIAVMIGQSLPYDVLDKIITASSQSPHNPTVIVSEATYDVASDFINAGINMVQLDEYPVVVASLKKLVMSLDLNLRPIEVRAHYVESEPLFSVFKSEE